MANPRKSVKTQEEQLRTKRSIGDWFFVTGIVLLLFIGTVDVMKDNSIQKIFDTVSRMTSSLKR